MKYNLQTSIPWVKIMKVTCSQLLIALILTGISYAKSTNAQQILDKKITITASNTILTDVLNAIEKTNGVKFIFSKNTIDVNQKVDINADQEKLKLVLDRLLSTRGIKYEVLKNQIILERAASVAEITPPTNNTDVSAADNRTVEANKFSVSGKISDERGSPLVGVSILEKGTNNGVVSDANGRYKISVNDTKAVLVITSIGYISQEVSVGSNSELNISLAADSKSLNEIVVIGYGTVKKRDLTGSVSSIKAADIEQAKAPNFQEAIQGKLAGVQVQASSGEPGTAMNISIRGANSVYAGSTPLFIIDGVPYDANSTELTTASVGNTTSTNPLAFLNPDDIASIDVLKDASSTAIYGSKGANGVIIITTKSGKSGKPIIEYDGFVGFSTATKKIAVLSANDWLNFEKEVNPLSSIFYKDTNNDGVYAPPDPLVNLDSLKKHNWQDELLRTGFSQNHNLSFSGKSGKTSYSAGFGYLNQNAIVDNNNYDRYSARLKIDQEFSSKVTMGLNLNTAYTNTSGATESGGGSTLFDGVVQDLVIARPVEIYNPNFDVGGSYISPKDEIDNSYKVTGTTQNNLSAYVNYKIIPDLTLNISGGGILTSSKTSEFYGALTTTAVNYNGLGILQQANASSLFNTNQLTYDKAINENNHINAILGTEIDQYTYTYFNVEKGNFADASTGINDISKGTNAVGSSSYKDVNRRLSYFSRINYSLNNKYLFTATLRADGSDKFGPGNRYGYFPSGAFAWVASDEKFLKDIKQISSLKLRLSYGESGNDRITSYQYLATLANAYYNGSLGEAPNTLANPNLKWETTAQEDIGIDLGLFDNRISITTDVYSKQTRNMLLPVNVPAQTGYNTQWQNAGRVDNRGIEFAINTRNIVSTDFEWSTGFNISSNRNEVKSLGNLPYIDVNMPNGWIQDAGRVTVGQPIGTAYGYVANGVYQIKDFTWQNNSDPSIPFAQRTWTLKPGVVSVAGINVIPGSLKFKDLNGDGVVDADHDRTTISHSSPKFIGGISNSFRYKQFDLSIFFQGSYGAQVFNEAKYQLNGGQADTYQNIYQSFYADHWSPTNPSNKYPNYADLDATSQIASSYYVESASYLRLKNLTVGYSLGKDLVKKIGIASARIYFTGTNLITWTPYTGFDPEVTSENPLLTGYDRISYPNARTLTFGINVGF